MRNYILTWWRQWDVHYDDGGGGSGDYTLRAGGGTREQLDEIVSSVNAQQSVLNPTFTFTFSYPTDPFKAYWLLDKENFIALCQYNVLPDVFFTIAQGIAAGIPTMTQVENSPRSSGWKDVDGNSRKPPPSERKKADFRGAAGLLVALQGLLKLAADLTALRKFRQAGIVLYAYNQVIKQTWSITQAIQYLIDSGITATI